VPVVGITPGTSVSYQTRADSRAVPTPGFRSRARAGASVGAELTTAMDGGCRTKGCCPVGLRRCRDEPKLPCV
jgi:hypothetical protein